MALGERVAMVTLSLLSLASRFIDLVQSTCILLVARAARPLLGFIVSTRVLAGACCSVNESEGNRGWCSVRDFLEELVTCAFAFVGSAETQWTPSIKRLEHTTAPTKNSPRSSIVPIDFITHSLSVPHCFFGEHDTSLPRATFGLLLSLFTLLVDSTTPM